MIEISGQIKWNEPSFHAVLLGYKNKNSCLVVCLRKVDGIFHLLSTTVESEIITALWLIANSNMFSDSDETSSSGTALYYLHIKHQLILFLLNTFSFLFLQTSLFISLISLSLDLVEPCTVLNLLLPYNFFRRFFLPWIRQALITSSSISALG